MDRMDVIEKLKQCEGEIRALGVDSLFLYGSYARDAARPESDIDVFVDRRPGAFFGLMQLTGLVHLLEDAFGGTVDAGTREGLHPILRPEIERTAIRVF